MKLLIARHGNTFTADEQPRRVGAKTNIPLVPRGIEQATLLGQFFKKNNIIPDMIYCSELQRTQQTAEQITAQLNKAIPMIACALFNEIDYGIDENKPEAEVIDRLGSQALEAWETQCLVPDGWRVDCDQIRRGWRDFSQQVLDSGNKTVLVVTSNGIARFALDLLAEPQAFDQENSRKLATGAYGCLAWQGDQWQVECWNQRPD